MTDRLLGRKVVIAGASSGIGLATAKLCVAEGARVVMLARGKDRLLTEADNIGSNAVPIVCATAPRRRPPTGWKWRTVPWSSTTSE